MVVAVLATAALFGGAVWFWAGTSKGRQRPQGAPAAPGQAEDAAKDPPPTETSPPSGLVADTLALVQASVTDPAKADELARWVTGLTARAQAKQLTAEQAEAFAYGVGALAGLGRMPRGWSRCEATALAQQELLRVQGTNESRLRLLYAQAQAALHDENVPSGFLEGCVRLLLELAQQAVVERNLAECVRLLVHVCCERWDWAGAERALTAFDDREPEAVERAVLALARAERLRRLGLPDQAALECERAGRALAAAPARNERVEGYLVAEELAQRLATDQFEQVVLRVDELQRAGRALDLDTALAKATAYLVLDQPQEAQHELSRHAAALASPLLPRAARLRARILSAEAHRMLGELTEAEQCVAEAESVVLDGDLDQRASLGSLRARLALASSDRVRQRAAYDEVVQVLAALRARVRAAPARAGGVGYLHFEPWMQLVGDAVDLALELDPTGAAEALEIALWVQSAGSLQRDLEAARADAPPSPKPTASASAPSARPDSAASEAPGGRLRRLLATSLFAPGRGVLLYWPSRYGGHLFAVDPEGTVSHQATTARDQMEKTCARFMRALLASDPDVAGLEAMARDAARCVFADEVCAKLATWRGFTFVGGSLLKGLAVGALLLPGSDLLLGQTHAVASLSSLPLAELLEDRRARQPASERQLALLVNVAPTPLPAGVEALALTDDEAVDLTGSATSVTIRVDNGLSPQDVVALDLSHTAILHLMAHASAADYEREDWYGLALSADATHRDGVLRRDDVLRMRAPGVVVLSACRVGAAPRRLGEDHLVNLGGAFVAAGAHTVVQSRAPLRKGRLAQLWRSACEKLWAGASTAEALRHARAALDAQERFHDATIEVWGLGHVAPWVR